MNDPNRNFPHGTVTFLFTDIEGSTKLLQILGEDYSTVLADQRAILRTTFHKYNGYEVDTQGDAFFVAFARASDAISASIEAQGALERHPWPQNKVVRVRMGLHTGEPLTGPTGYVGMDVHRAARIAHVAHGGQVLLSETTYSLVRDELPEGVNLRNLGQHRLKDLQRPEYLFQLVIPGSISDFPALKSLDVHPHNLPVQPTPLVGRESELAVTRKLALRPEVRLITLTGPGGTGKTRLGLQLAANLLNEFPDGVYFVPLTPVHNSDLVASTIAQTLGLRDRGGQPLIETLTEHLRLRSMLLLLDNLEHLAAAANLIAELISICPEIKFLVTSREALHLRAEYEYYVPPLPVPDITLHPPTQRLAQNPSVILFTQRAGAVLPSFCLTDDNANAIAEICARLDGLPLAIELAAARIKLLPPQAMLKRFAEVNGGFALSMLSGRVQDAPERHRTLHATIDWSYQLLNPIEKGLFRSLSVFRGGFTLLAAQAVCCTETFESLEVMEYVESLIDKSLLRQEKGPTEEPRFFMLGMIRQYALEELRNSGQEQNIQDRHAYYYMELAIKAESLLKGPEQEIWFELLEYERNNMRAALTWFIQQAELETDLSAQAANSGLRLSTALWRFWDTHGYISEGRRWLDKALALTDSPTIERVNALNGAGGLAFRQSDYQSGSRLYEESLALAQKLTYKPGAAEALSRLGYLNTFIGSDNELVDSQLAESLELWRELGDQRGIAEALGPLAIRAVSRHDYEQAASIFEESLALFREVEDRREIAGALYNLGEVAMHSGNYDLAINRYKESLSIYDDLNDTHGIATQLRCMGEVERLQGHCEQAKVFFQEALKTFKSIGDKFCSSHTINGLGRIALFQGDYLLAITLFQETLDFSRESKNRNDIARALYLLGLAELAQGEVNTASQHFLECLNLGQEIGNAEYILAALDGMARVAVSQDKLLSAAKLFAAKDALRSELGITLAPIDQVELDRYLSTLQSRLNESDYQSAINEGRTLTLEQSIKLAIKPG